MITELLAQAESGGDSPLTAVAIAFFGLVGSMFAAWLSYKAAGNAKRDTEATNDHVDTGQQRDQELIELRAEIAALKGQQPAGDDPSG